MRRSSFLWALVFLIPVVAFAHGGGGGGFKWSSLRRGWMPLEKAKEEKVPVEQILQITPEANRIRPRSIPFTKWQIEEIEQKIGPLEEGEKELKLYEVKRDGLFRLKKKLGKLIFFTVKHAEAEETLAMRLTEEGQLIELVALQQEKTLGQEFWGQFAQKNLKDAWAIGQDLKAPQGQEETAQRIADAGKRALLLTLTALRLAE